MSPWCSGALLALLPIAAGLCEDAQTDNDRASCASWAKDGECDRNPDYMRLNCAASCGFCSTPPPTSDGHSSTILIETLLAKLKTARAWPPASKSARRPGPRRRWACRRGGLDDADWKCSREHATRTLTGSMHRGRIARDEDVKRFDASLFLLFAAARRRCALDSFGRANAYLRSE